jgi:hypothetical protein
LPDPIREFLGDAVQRDDDEVNPLQAADLIAALAKDQCNDQQDQRKRKAISRLAGSDEYNVTLHLKRERLVKIVEALQSAPPLNHIVSGDGAA